MLLLRIFEVEPAAKHLFDFARSRAVDSEELYNDPKFIEHARTVIRMVTAAIGLLEQGDMGTLVQALRDLGARHVTYNVSQEHFPIVGEALIMTLAAALGDMFTEEVKEEWLTVADVIFTTMATTWA
ncbi:hypothetical protein ACA910_021418 [Epithemia clementina (nom. ined.)]